MLASLVVFGVGIGIVDVQGASAGTSVLNPTLTLSSSAAGATLVSYTVTFTTSSSGAIPAGSDITLAAPAGTVFAPCDHYVCGTSSPPAGTYYVTDLTNSSSSGEANTTVVSNGGATVAVVISKAIAAGDSISLAVTNVQNAPTGAGSLAISTSSDQAAASIPLTTTTPNAVSSSTVAMSDHTASATGVSYTVTMATSATGALVGGYGAITVNAPTGTIFAPCDHYVCGTGSPPEGSYYITDLTSSSSSGNAAGTVITNGGATVEVILAKTIAAGDSIVLAITQVTNPSTSGGSFSLTTTSDTAPATPQVLASIDGTVTYQGHPVASAPVEACPTGGGSCTTGTTASDGSFAVGGSSTPGSTYSLTAFPPSSGVNASSATVGPITVPGPQGVSGVAIVLGAPAGLASGVTITTPEFGSESSATTDPVAYWNSPFQVTFPASLFPTGNVLITQVDITGVDARTGLVTRLAIAPGGKVNGVNIPVPAGSPITIPSLNPIHGPVQLDPQYVSYSSSLPTPTGVAHPAEVDFVSPSGVDQVLPVTNVGIPGGVTITVSKIIGTNANDFSLVDPKTMDTGLPECNGVVLDEANAGTGTGTAECSSQFHWSPNGSDPYEYATAIVNVGGNAPIAVALVGCNSALTTCATSGNGAGFTGNGGPSGPTFTIPGPGGTGPGGDNGTGGDGGDVGGPYVDPSGVVVTHTASGDIPLKGATVTLEQGPSASGPFAAVPNGSAVMSPANRVNPGTTGSDGSFGWDTIAGTYDVTASLAGCTSGDSGAATVPPPVSDLKITLVCASPPSRSSSSTVLTSSVDPVNLGAPLGLTAKVTGSSPTGTVDFKDGSNLLGSAPVDGSGNAVLTSYTLTPGAHTLTAAYSGDGANVGSTSSNLSETVVGSTTPKAPEILTTSLPSPTVGQPYATTIGGYGGQAPYHWKLSGKLPSGLTFNDATGTISGTATTPGVAKLRVQLTDSTLPRAQKVKATLDIQVLPVSVTITPSALPGATLDKRYSEHLVASGGSKPYAFAVTSGSLPPGLVLDGSGKVGGKPTQSGSYSFGVSATDRYGNTGSASITVTVQ